MRIWSGWLFAAWWWVLAGTAGADSPLRVDASGERMRVDGALREWKGAHFVSLGDQGETQLRVALATADGGLYVGAEVHDDQVVRGKGVGGSQDVLVLTLALPDARGALTTTEVHLHPGVSGRSKAEAGLRKGRGALRSEARIRVVEGPREGGEPGFVIEAFVPWSLVEGAEIWEQGRGALHYEDVDKKGATPTRVGSSQAREASALPRLALGEGHQDFLGSFLRSQELVGVAPRFDLRGNVHGDKAPERVAIVDRFVVVYGPGYQEGKSYGYAALPLGTGGGIKQAELRDFTGDGLAELVITLRQRNELGAREVWMVYALSGASPEPAFGLELRKEAAGGFLENRLEVRRERGALRMVVTPGRAQGVDASTFREAPARDVQPILTPWGDVKARTYGFVDGSFRVVSEEKQEGARAAAAPAASTPAQPAELAEPIAPSVEAVLSLFKRQAKLPAKMAPRRAQHGNFLGGPQHEQLFQLGAHLVLLGPELGGGGSYLAYSLPVTQPEDIVYLGHADATGDGLHEIFVRIRQPLSGAEGVHRELVLVLRADPRGKFTRALAAEVTRRQGEHVVANRVVARGGRLVIEPGTAKGWSDADYPFTNEATGGAERLLLPWLDQARTYRLSGELFVGE